MNRAFAFVLLAAGACRPSTAPAPMPMAPSVEAPDTSPKPPRFERQLLEIAREYAAWGRVDDEVRWAPWLCRMPNPSVARFSAGEEGRAHGGKLYFVFAKDREAYVAAAKGPQAVGQAVVKESWTPREVDASTERRRVHDEGARGAYVPYAERDGTIWHASERAGLFILFKADTAADTDGGWVYGTVTADGKRVTASGRVASCMACHAKAEHDRLFGLAAK
jgi:hypothetical protein